MWTWLAAYGGSSSFLILFIGLPAIYYLLAYDAHKDFSDTLSNMHKNGVLTDPDSVAKYEAGGRDMLQAFELEWWIIIAFAILVSSILVSGYAIPTSSVTDAAALSEQCTIEKAKAGECLDMKSSMALYAAMIGLLVAFRLAWIRLSLLRFTGEFQIERVVEALANPKKTTSATKRTT